MSRPADMPDIVALLIVDSIAPSVDDQPSFDIVCWQVLEEIDSGTRFLIGYNATDGRARISSAIRRFEPLQQSATTASGRLYKLCGPHVPIAVDPVWQSYLCVRGFDLKRLIDVSCEFLAIRH